MIKIFNILDYTATNNLKGALVQKIYHEKFKLKSKYPYLLGIYYDVNKNHYILLRMDSNSPTVLEDKLDVADTIETEYLTEEQYSKEVTKLIEYKKVIETLKNSLKTKMPNIIGKSRDVYKVYYESDISLYKFNKLNAKQITRDDIYELDELIWFNIFIAPPELTRNTKEIINSFNEEVVISEYMDGENDLPKSDNDNNTDILMEIQTQELANIIKIDESDTRVTFDIPKIATTYDVLEAIGKYFDLDVSQVDMLPIVISIEDIITTIKEEGMYVSADGMVFGRCIENLDIIEIQDDNYLYPIYPNIKNTPIVNLEMILHATNTVIVHNDKMIDSSHLMDFTEYTQLTVLTLVGRKRLGTLHCLPCRLGIYLISYEWMIGSNAFGLQLMNRR